MDKKSQDSFLVQAARLARGLQLLAELIRDPAGIDEDASLEPLRKGKAPRRSAEHAIANVKRIEQLLLELQENVRAMPDHSIVRSIEETLIIMHECIGQVSVPAEFMLMNRDKKGAVECIMEAVSHAYERCGEALEGYASQLFVSGRRGLPGTIPEGSAVDGADWSTASTPTFWALQFGVNVKTFKRWCDEGKVRAKKLSSKSYQVHLADLPKGKSR